MDLAKENPKTVAVLAFGIAVMFLGVTTLCGLRAAYIARVTDRQRETSAVIESSSRTKNTDIYSYRFNTPESGVYYGMSPAPGGESYSIGKIIEVYYDPLYPATNSPVEFSENYTPAVVFMALMSGLAAIAALYGAFMWRRKPAPA